MEYLQGDQGKVSDKYSPHVEYKRLKKVLKSCRACRASALKESNSNGEEDDHETSNLCQFESCQCTYCFFPPLFNLWVNFIFRDWGVGGGLLWIKTHLH